MASLARCQRDKAGLVCAIAARADEPVPVPDTVPSTTLFVPIFRNQVGVEGDAILYQFA